MQIEVGELALTGAFSCVWGAYGSHHHFARGPVNYNVTDRWREHGLFLIFTVIPLNRF